MPIHRLEPRGLTIDAVRQSIKSLGHQDILAIGRWRVTLASTSTRRDLWIEKPDGALELLDCRIGAQVKRILAAVSEEAQ